MNHTVRCTRASDLTHPACFLDGQGHEFLHSIDSEGEGREVMFYFPAIRPSATKQDIADAWRGSVQMSGGCVMLRGF